jgi:membrane protease YdiL (CAAX protease family)
MPIDPETLPPAVPFTTPEPAAQTAGARQTIPNLAHTLLFCGMVLISGLLLGLVSALFLQKAAIFHHESAEALQTDPRVVVPLEVLIYAVAAMLAWWVFPRIWRLPMLRALRWNPGAVQRRWLVLAATGAVLSGAVQLLSNYLPIPKNMPIDQFFTNRTGIWIVAVFGVTVAPFFEELAFRGFLLPSLANAWDWMAGLSTRRRAARETRSFSAAADLPVRPAGDPLPESSLWPNGFSLPYDGGPATDEFSTAGWRPAAPEPFRPDLDSPDPATVEDPRWSTPALVFAVLITSVLFALLHAEQLAHAWAPLGVLFTVSVVLCVVRLRARSLAASAFVHACYNGSIFVLLFIGTDGFRHLDKMN